MNQQLVIAAPEVKADNKMLAAYQSYVQNVSATSDDLYRFLTQPSASRDEFLAKCCKHTINASNHHLTQKYESIS